ncbi:MAG: hypothetical protein VX640_00855 [Pseudomonadota bacterium]|nr:hypothetical protein [Pseudomonadota bacterium]
MRLPALILALIALPMQGNTQGLAPMRQDFATYADQFAIRLTARNPYPTAQRFSVTVYEEDWRISAARALAPVLTIAPNETVSFLVAGDTDEREARAIHVCIRSAPFVGEGGASIRGEVCGRYRILQRRL